MATQLWTLMHDHGAQLGLGFSTQGPKWLLWSWKHPQPLLYVVKGVWVSSLGASLSTALPTASCCLMVWIVFKCYLGDYLATRFSLSDHCFSLGRQVGIQTNTNVS